MGRTITFPFTIAVALSLTACAESGTGPDNTPSNGGDGGNSRSIVADPSFDSVVQEIFNRKGCAGGSCHGSAASAGLSLSAGTSYANLINVASTQTGTDRVIPGNATDSYLIVKVEGRQTVGQQMPLGGSALDNIDLTNLKNWINEGAKNN